jgi:D-tyrosyl-tRNA(Tyr) deacylase
VRAVVQRVSRASVRVDNAVCGEIGAGLLVLLAVLRKDTQVELDFMARKVAGLRIFADAEGKMNLDVRDSGGSVLVVSQFTLAAPTASGNRPSFSSAMPPEEAEDFVEQFKGKLSRVHGLQVASGIFGASMQVELVNDGPVTILLDTDNRS